MIRTEIKLSDPKTGKAVPVSSDFADSVREASKMLEELGREIDPLQFEATWQFEGPSSGPEVVNLTLSYDDVRGRTDGFLPEWLKDKYALRMRLGHILSEFASQVARSSFQKFLQSKQGWENTASVEG